MFHKNRLDNKDDAENLDLVISMYNQLHYSLNCSDTTRSLWFCSKDERNNFSVNYSGTNYFKSFRYKVKLLRNTAPDGRNEILKNAIAVSLNQLSNFWESLKIPLINC